MRRVSYVWYVALWLLSAFCFGDCGVVLVESLLSVAYCLFSLRFDWCALVVGRCSLLVVWYSLFVVG